MRKKSELAGGEWSLIEAFIMGAQPFLSIELLLLAPPHITVAAQEEGIKFTLFARSHTHTYLHSNS